MKYKSEILLFLLFSFLFSACLKTRAQLRDDSDERQVARPTSVSSASEVEPKGQYVIDEMKSEFTRFEGRIEDLERNQKGAALKSVSAEEFKKLESRMIRLEESEATLTEIIKKLQESLLMLDPNEVYKKAKMQFDDQDYEGCAESLAFYVKSSKVKHPEEGIFLRGQCFYKAQKYKNAIVEYSKFSEKYPHYVKSPEAFYKIGLSFDALGLKEDAKGFYQELVEKYPKTPEAKKARKKIK